MLPSIFCKNPLDNLFGESLRKDWSSTHNPLSVVILPTPDKDACIRPPAVFFCSETDIQEALLAGL